MYFKIFVLQMTHKKTVGEFLKDNKIEFENHANSTSPNKIGQKSIWGFFFFCLYFSLVTHLHGFIIPKVST